MRFFYKAFVFIALLLGVASGAMAARAGSPMDLFLNNPIPALSAIDASSAPAADKAAQAKTMQAKIEDAIVRGGLKQNWIITKNSDGTMNAHLSIRVHTLDLTIKFHDNMYDILYKDSTNLQYEPNPTDPSRPMIHPNVNKWIRNLILDINSQFAGIN